MDTAKVLLNETIYRSRVQKMEHRDTVTRYLTWGLFECLMRNNERVLGHMLSTEEFTEEIPVFSLNAEQDQALAEKGFWQCLHDGKHCAQVKENEH